jgi:4-diphosphocytidyl-2-C-methyl-D-erythritol kinase
MKKRFSSPCKINLFLDVEGRREDGFHNLRTLFWETTFGDAVQVENDYHGIQENRFQVNGPFAQETPTDQKNLFLRGLNVYAEATGKPQHSHGFILTKNVPPQAGLGGGSSNGAAALKIANSLNTQNPLPPEELERLAGTLGSDCAFFINGGVQQAKGRGEKLVPLTKVLRKPSIVILVPQSRVPTPAAFAHLIPEKDFGLKSNEAELVRWLRGESLVPLREIPLYNAFQRSVSEEYSDVRETLEILTSFNPAKVLLSGSGSACFALFDQAIPEAVKNTVEELMADPWFRLAVWEEPNP